MSPPWPSAPEALPCPSCILGLPAQGQGGCSGRTALTQKCIFSKRGRYLFSHCENPEMSESHPPGLDADHCFPNSSLCRLGQHHACVCPAALPSCPAPCDPLDWGRQAALSTGFSRQEVWSGLPCPPPGRLPNPGMELESPVSPALAGHPGSRSSSVDDVPGAEDRAATEKCVN